MKVKIVIITVVLIIAVFGGLGYGVYRYLSAGNTQNASQDGQEKELALPPIDSSVIVTVKAHPTENHTTIMKVTGLDNRYAAIEYDFEYDSNGRILGVNSGTKPLDITGQQEFTRDIYLGTCSKNVCKPDTGVTKVTVTMKLTSTDGKKSQFSGDFNL
jgi:hypothetical protein